MNIEKYSSIELANSKKYIVAEKLDMNDSTYLMLLEEKEQIEDKPLFVKLINNGLQILKGEEQKEIIDIMLPLFETDYI